MRALGKFQDLAEVAWMERLIEVVEGLADSLADVDERDRLIDVLEKQMGRVEKESRTCPSKGSASVTFWGACDRTCCSQISSDCLYTIMPKRKSPWRRSPFTRCRGRFLCKE
jgi:hypothetical protein